MGGACCHFPSAFTSGSAEHTRAAAGHANRCAVGRRHMLASQEPAAHPALWLLLTCCRYRKPLPPRYQAVLDSLAAQQKEIEAHHERNHKSEASGFAGGHVRCLAS